MLTRLVLLIITASVGLVSAATLSRPIPDYINHQNGMQRCLAFAIHYTDKDLKPITESWAAATIDNHHWLAEQSYSATGMQFDVILGVVEMGIARTEVDSWGEEWSIALARLEEQYPQYDTGSYDRLWMVQSAEKCGMGCAYVGGTKFAINGAENNYTQHEIAHTYGLSHNYRDLTGYDIGSVIVPPTKISWGWMKQSDPDGFGYGIVTASGTYRIHDFRDLTVVDGAQRALFLRRDDSTTHAGFALSFTRQRKSTQPARGVAIWDFRKTDETHSRLDFLPETSDVQDGDLLEGDSHTTADGRWRITVLSVDNTQPAYVDVQIELLEDLPGASPPEAGLPYAADALTGWTHLGTVPQVRLGSPTLLKCNGTMPMAISPPTGS